VPGISKILDKRCQARRPRRPAWQRGEIVVNGPCCLSCVISSLPGLSGGQEQDRCEGYLDRLGILPSLRAQSLDSRVVALADVTLPKAVEVIQGDNERLIGSPQPILIRMTVSDPRCPDAASQADEGADYDAGQSDKCDRPWAIHDRSLFPQRPVLPFVGHQIFLAEREPRHETDASRRHLAGGYGYPGAELRTKIRPEAPGQLI
jgi:hypothetical protein